MEIWRNVKGTFGCYKISNLGNYASYRGRQWNDRKPWITTGGYLCVDIYVNEKRTTPKVHRLVAEAFLPNPNNHRVVNHKNGIKTDNHIDNLEWCNHSYNNQHAWDTGLKLKTLGENHPQASLTQEQADEIRKIRKDRKIRRSHLAEKYNVSIPTIDRILGNRAYVNTHT